MIDVLKTGRAGDLLEHLPENFKWSYRDSVLLRDDGEICVDVYFPGRRHDDVTPEEVIEVLRREL